MRWKKEDRLAHVELWEKSGMSRAAYCREAGIAYHLLTDWVRQRNRAREAEQDGAESSAGFVEVTESSLPQRCARPAPLPAAVLNISGEISLRIESAAHASAVAASIVAYLRERGAVRC